VRRWQGSSDTPLTRLGRQQALAVADRLLGLDVEFCGPWASDLDRAASTASAISSVIGLGPTIVDPALREAAAGEWEGLTPEQIEARYPGWLAADRRPVTFEPLAQVVGRAIASLRAIAASVHPTDAIPLVVTHSGVIRSVIRHLGGSDSRIPNLGGVWLTIDHKDSTTERLTELFGAGGIAVGDLYNPGGIVVSGIDIPGEDPR